MLSDNSFQALEESLRGELIQPDDQRYDTARKLYNGMIDRYPINRAAHDVGPKDTAFSYREATWAEKIVGVVGITSAPMTLLTTSRAAQANSAETGLGFRRTGCICHKFCASNYHPKDLSIEPCARERGMPPRVFISHSSKDKRGSRCDLPSTGVFGHPVLDGSPEHRVRLRLDRSDHAKVSRPAGSLCWCFPRMRDVRSMCAEKWLKPFRLDSRSFPSASKILSPRAA